jgi:hypothetical protein
MESGRAYILDFFALFGVLAIQESSSSSYKEVFQSFFANNPLYQRLFKKGSKYLFVGSFYNVHDHALVKHIPTIRVVGEEATARVTAASMIDEVLKLNRPKYKAILSCRKLLVDVNYCPKDFLQAQDDRHSTVELWYLLPSESSGAVKVQRVLL